MRALLIVLIFTGLSGSALAVNPSPPDWRDLNIYHIFTDRFFDGDPSNNDVNPEAPFRPQNPRGIHGGDFRGIEKKLDYLQTLGVDALWISPIPQNVGRASYHGYGAHDFYALAPHWGTMEDLRSLVSSVHARGMYMVLDIVCNHTGDRIYSHDPGWPRFNLDGYTLRWRSGQSYPPPFDKLEFFHPYGEIQNYIDPEQILGEVSGLDDLKTETQYVRDRMFEIYSHWIREADFDGFRIDTVKHVDIGFWQDFNPRIREFASSIGKTNFFQFGEVLDGSNRKNGFYTGTIAGGAFANDSVLDFPLYFLVNEVFARGRGATILIEEHYREVEQTHDPSSWDKLVTFIDNHDMPRFLSEELANHHQDRLHLALSFLYTSRGIPCLYYGTEQNFSGGRDPANRENMFDGHYGQGPSLGDNFNMTHPTYLHVARLNNLRRLYPELRRGSHLASWNNPRSPGLLAYIRENGADRALVVLNTADSPQHLPPRRIPYPAGTRMVNLLDPDERIEVTSGERGFPAMTIPPFAAKIFVRAERLAELDPLVTHQSPRHGSIATAPQRFFRIRFSHPMDPDSVRHALSVSPPVHLDLDVSPDLQTYTLTPRNFAELPSGRYDIRIEPTALAASGLPLRAAYETFFQHQPHPTP